MLAPPRTVAGRYEIAEPLGAGGMGTVYRARDLLLDEEVALKLLHRELVSSPEAVRRFRREVKLARRITHPNIARVFDMGLADGQPYLTMELIEGEPLSTIIEEGALPPERAAAIGAQIARGLAAAHDAGIVHRDLKPDNVIVVGERVVVTDFGIARAVAVEAGSRTTGVVGTPHYMAPEQVTAGRLDARTDIYALGVVLFELATGELPFPGDSAYLVATARLARPAPDPRSLHPVPDDLAAVIARCLERDPERRFAAVAEVATALEGSGATPSMVSRRPALAVQIEAGDDLARGAADLIASALRACGLRLTFANEGEPTLLLALASQGDHVVGRARLGDGDWSRALELPARELGDRAHDLAGEVAAALGVVRPSARERSEALPIALVRARGAAHRSDGLDTALALLEEAARERPDEAAVQIAYAAALVRRAQEQGDFDGDLDEALALAAASRSPEAMLVRGAASLDLGDSLGALEALAAADPGHPAWSALMGRLLALANDWHRARRALARAVSAGERSPALAVDHAFAEAATGDLEAARARLEVDRPELASWWLGRARLGLWAGDLAPLRAHLGDIAAARFVGRDDVLAFVAASCGAGSLAESLRRLDEAIGRCLRNRRRAASLSLAAVELALSRGERELALDRLEVAAGQRLVDAGWLGDCPLASRLAGESAGGTPGAGAPPSSCRPRPSSATTRSSARSR